MASDRLAEYNSRRNFDLTAEPQGKISRKRKHQLRFLVQKHEARRLHYDFRLEWDGVLLSWAVTRGPSNDPSQKRLAVQTEDHPLSYGNFEGTIPAGEYGGGTVILWDEGIWIPANDPESGLADGKLQFTLRGERMRGNWVLVRMKARKKEKRSNWLLIKQHDSFSSDEPKELTEYFTSSVRTGRSLAALSIAPYQPPFTKPQLASLVRKVPAGNEWLHETKFDGYRCLGSVGKQGVKLYTRSGHDWSDKFAPLSAALEALNCDNALLDGEVVAESKTGSWSFSALQKSFEGGGKLVYQVFDLLYVNGKDLRNLPLGARKQALQELLKKSKLSAVVRFSEGIHGKGEEILRRICRVGGEGIISKRIDSPYRGGRNRYWLKVKCTKRQEFVIGGFSPSDKPFRPFASVLVGSYEKEQLIYRGRIGTGFTQDELESLALIFRHLARKTNPFQIVPPDISRSARWLNPELVIEVDYSELTDEGHIRHGVYLGHRLDKHAEEVVMDKPVQSGVAISNASREVFPQAGITKVELAHYYEDASERILAIAARRPLSLLRCPAGIKQQCFYQRHAGKGFPKDVQSISISGLKGSSHEYLYVSSVQGLIAAVQMGAVEFHMWGSRNDLLEKPDRLVFDLDPDEGLSFSRVKAAGFMMRDLLLELGFSSVPLLTGGKGLHVCVPLRRTVSWESLKTFAKVLASLVANEHPDLFVATASKAKRRNKIFIDWLRNQRGATAIVPYAVRARPGAALAIPVTWQELEKVKAANAFSMSHLADRMQQPCPYLATLEKPQSLTLAVIKRLENRAQNTHSELPCLETDHA